MLEPVGLRVDGIDAEAEDIREVELEQAVMAEQFQSEQLAGGCEAYTAIRGVLDEAELSELLDHGRSG